MRKTGKIALVILSLTMLLSLFAGCQKQEETVTIKLSEVTHSVFYAPQYVAINRGFFENEGIEIELMNGGGADKVMTAVLSGGVDIGFAGPEASIYVYNEGKANYCQIFAQVTKRDGSFLISREENPDFKWSDLKNKEVLPGRKGGVPYMTLMYVIRKMGLDPSKDLVLNDTIQFDLMASAFVNGTGDFVTAFEPVATSIEESGKGHIVASVGEESGEIPYTAYFATKSYIEENSDIIQRFTKALYKGQLWVRDHTADEIANAIAPSFPDTDIETLVKVVQRYKDIDAWCDGPLMKEEAFNKLQDVMVQAGELTQRAVYGDIVNNSFAEKLMK